MPKIEVDYAAHFAQFNASLTTDGALLVSLDENGRPNPMTIGWAMLGVVWSLPICTVLVRPSRYTYGCMNATGDFTVCVPYPGMGEEVMFCGTRSGRRYDKMAECGFTALPSQTVKSPGIDECGLILECRTMYTSDIDPANLSSEIGAYASGDYHRIYYGMIQRTIADEGFAERYPA